eukprot:TRINITY_DN5468_c0_g2_i3.p1 TRINITY_DN5468_c0_g2~~TRINITY_DN5468_c0_g2_i3.p1  ORF type:complete len:263 (-),score=15.68 TRINITY_DN5468_c0_g2_i3:283-1071(-)
MKMESKYNSNNSTQQSLDQPKIQQIQMIQYKDQQYWNQSWNIQYRPLVREDFKQVKSAHKELFPIDYDDSFFEKAVGSREGIFSYAAVCGQQLVGFVTCKMVCLKCCDPVDRKMMELSNHVLDDMHVIYVLTLGVLPSHQKQGIASQLIRYVVEHAVSNQCVGVFLHVIAYNQAAISLYDRNYFICKGLLRDFYTIRSDRQPEKDKVLYDAYLYSYQIQQQNQDFSGHSSLFSTASYPIRQLLTQCCWPFSSTHQSVSFGAM